MANNRAQLYKYKGNMCTSCGKSVKEMLDRFGTFERLFDLHHVDPEKKDKNYNNLIRRKLSTKQIDELDKCVLLCKECHGLVHAQNLRVDDVTLSLDYNGTTVRQSLNGWIIQDFHENSFKLIVEGELLIEPYYEKINNEKQGVIFGTDLYSSMHLINRFKSLNNGDSYQIVSAENGDVLLTVNNLSGVLNIKHDIQFRFISMDGSKAPKGTKFWYRNGVVLRENGEVVTDGDWSFSISSNQLP
ncbi:HNH endonuclease signature motif containing protein [Vibrio jasicida]|uniref:HNH endonuclease signature motif containing protein n=1 Tax=Vibrio jasicida TaxID=766224 RepID=UPI00406767F5